MALSEGAKEELANDNGVLPRLLVVKVLEELWKGNEIKFTSSKGFRQLSPEDKGFAKLLYLTTLRHCGQIDALIDSLVFNAIKKKEKNLRDVLRIGVVQHHFMATPAHAIIATSLAILDKLNQSHFKPFAHAILSKIVKNIQAFMIKDTANNKNFPEWMFLRWKKQYGLGRANQITHAYAKQAQLDLSLKSNVNYWAKVLEAQVLPFDTIRIKDVARVESLKGYQEGEWWVQDWSSSLPVKLMNPEPGKKALDLCAAPGGKTAQLLARGLDVTSIEISADRLKRLKTNLLRLNMSSTIVQADAINWKSDQLYDYVLVDAPCSGTGTYRRHPERKFLRQEVDIEKLSILQELILRNAVNLLASGGILIYCTCSLEKEENEVQMQKLLETHPAIERVPFQKKELPPALEALITPQGDVQIFPYDLEEYGGTDGFYISRLQRVF